jgi:hypothetical protein
LLNGVEYTNIATIQDIYNMLYEYLVNLIALENLPDGISERYCLQVLIEQGCLCFYRNIALNKLVALYASNIAEEDIYGDPQLVVTTSRNGLIHDKVKVPEDGVLVWANKTRIPIVYRVNMYASRLFQIKRALDINISQFKIPRVLSVPKTQVQTVLNLINQLDENRPFLVVDSGLSVDNWSVLATDVPSHVTELIDAWNQELNSFFNWIGISSKSEKKERLVTNEAFSSNEPVISARRFIFGEVESCFERVNEKFGTDIQVKFTTDWSMDAFDYLKNLVDTESTDNLGGDEVNG